MAKGMAGREAPDGTNTEAAVGLAALRVSRVILDLLVQQGTLTHQAIGLALLKHASSLDTGEPIQKAAQHLLLHLSKLYSEGHGRQRPSRPRTKWQLKRRQP
jgi:hypothetical protein